MATSLQAELAVVAEFPESYFLENLAVRSDASVLITAMNKKELWCVPGANGALPVTPSLIHSFEMMTFFVVETEPDIFVIGVADGYDTLEARLHRLDLRKWTVGERLNPELILEFPAPRVGLNGGCLIAPNVLLAAGAKDLIWRVDLPADGSSPAVREWLAHDNMRNRPGEKQPEQPGINGVHFDERTNYLYYTSTSQQLMLRVAVHPETHDPVGLPEYIAGGREWDDFIIDEPKGVAYVTTHRENTIDRVILQPDGNREGRVAVAGEPFNELLVGPSSGAWGREDGDYGRIAYFTTDGGTAAPPPDGKRRTAKLIRVTFPPTHSS